MSELNEFKIVTALVLVLKKIESEHRTNYDTFYSNSKAKTVINEITFMMIYIDDVFQSIYITIISNI